MGKMAKDQSASTNVDGFLRDELARGNRALRSVAPIIAHSLASDGPILVSDAIIAQVRGFLWDICDQLLGGGDTDLQEQREGRLQHQAMIDRLTGDAAIIDHLYALALEGSIAQRLKARAGIDPVLSPLLQELIASQQPNTAELAMHVLAAQSRFSQSHGRMELSLTELPSDILARLLGHFEQADLGIPTDQIDETLAFVKAEFDEGASRLGLLARLTSSLHGGAIAALDLAHAGIALFASATATLAKYDRDHAVFACHEGQSIRLGLSLKAAGLGDGMIEGQLELLNATQGLPLSIVEMTQAQAQELVRANAFGSLNELGGV